MGCLQLSEKSYAFFMSPVGLFLSPFSSIFHQAQSDLSSFHISPKLSVRNQRACFWLLQIYCVQKPSIATNFVPFLDLSESIFWVRGLQLLGGSLELSFGFHHHHPTNPSDSSLQPTNCSLTLSHASFTLSLHSNFGFFKKGSLISCSHSEVCTPSSLELFPSALLLETRSPIHRPSSCLVHAKVIER